MPSAGQSAPAASVGTKTSRNTRRRTITPSSTRSAGYLLPHYRRARAPSSGSVGLFPRGGRDRGVRDRGPAREADSSCQPPGREPQATRSVRRPVSTFSRTTGTLTLLPSGSLCRSRERSRDGSGRGSSVRDRALAGRRRLSHSHPAASNKLRASSGLWVVPEIRWGEKKKPSLGRRPLAWVRLGRNCSFRVAARLACRQVRQAPRPPPHVHHSRLTEV